jgi:hypothetical protein
VATVTLTCPYRLQDHPDPEVAPEVPSGPFEAKARKIKVKVHDGFDEKGQHMYREEDGLEVDHEDAACPDCGRVGAGDGSITIVVV